MFGSRSVNVTEMEFVVVSLLVPSELLYVTLYDETSEMESLIHKKVTFLVKKQKSLKTSFYSKGCELDYTKVLFLTKISKFTVFIVPKMPPIFTRNDQTFLKIGNIL